MAPLPASTFQFSTITNEDNYLIQTIDEGPGVLLGYSLRLVLVGDPTDAVAVAVLMDDPDGTQAEPGSPFPGPADLTKALVGDQTSNITDSGLPVFIPPVWFGDRGINYANGLTLMAMNAAAVPPGVGDPSLPSGMILTGTVWYARS